MLLVTVKPKFQITIPAKLRKGIDLHEGELMEATVVADGIFFRPMDVVSRESIAERIDSSFAATQPSSEDARRSQDKIMEDAIAEVAASRRDRRNPDA